jgi:RNA polymerase sigma-70 factor (ECF subfamily)
MNAPALSDQELIRDYLNGRESSLETIVLRHKDKLYSYIYNMVKCHQTADDIFQDAFIKVIHTLKSGNYNEEGKFIHWVTRIAHNLIIDHFRRSSRIPIQTNQKDQDPFAKVLLPTPSIEDILIEEQILKEIKLLVEELPEDQKQVLKMRHYMGLSFKEIAEQTDVSINTALGRMRYAIINLRKFASEKNLILSK